MFLRNKIVLWKKEKGMKQISNFNSKVRELLSFTVLQYMLDTLYENPILGRIYVDDEDNPSSCIVSLKHLLFFGGNPTQHCLSFLSNEILTKQTRKYQNVFYMICPYEAWKDALKDLFPGNCFEYERSLYRWNREGIDKLPSCDNIAEITSQLMNSTADNLEMITDEVISTGTYDDMEDYLMRGIGYTPVIDNRVCGFCTSEYPSKDAIAIGIEVLEEYQRQGYAKAMTKGFLNKASERGLTVYWECWRNNIASATTALSCGFEKVADYPILFVKL
jgi:RimJ/RimL family protein N-acetyltransferase